MMKMMIMIREHLMPTKKVSMMVMVLITVLILMAAVLTFVDVSFFSATRIAFQTMNKPTNLKERTINSFCPCNIIGLDDVSSGNVVIEPPPPPPFAAGTEDSAEIHPVGRLGNNLFQFSAGIITARENNISLVMKNTWHEESLPYFQQLRHNDSSDILNIVRLVGAGSKDIGAPFYQHADWVERFFLGRKDICHYLSMPSVLQLAADRPGLNDVVITIRKFGKGNWGSPFDKWRRKNRLSIPPLIYYERILDEGKFDNIWVVLDPCLQDHPIPQQLVRLFGAKFHNGSVEEDFQFISYAPTVILSPSTFSWWATFLGSTSHHRTIHFPIMPTEVPMPWCDLMLRWPKPNHPVTIYHDWYRNKSFTDDGDGSSTFKDAVYRRCKRYEWRPVGWHKKNKLLKYYTELRDVVSGGGDSCTDR